MKIVSLLPSSTEIVCALGRQHQLVGRSHECDYPKGVSDLPICSHPRINTEGTSAEIHERVSKALGEALSIYQIDVEQLKQLQPDVIITQDQCDVCAVSAAEVEKAVCETLESKPKVISLKTNCLEDLWPDIRKIASVIGAGTEGEKLIQKIQSEMETISEQAQSLARPRRSVACIEWLDPLMSAGNWVPEMIEKLGLKNLFGATGQHSPYLHWDDLEKANPDMVLMFPCGWCLHKSLAEFQRWRQGVPIRNLGAFRREEVYLIDGNQYLNRPGPRLLDSFKIFAEIFYPDVFDFGLKTAAWRHLSKNGLTAKR